MSYILLILPFQVVVYDETTNKRYVFPCDRWLARNEDDGQIRRRLKVMDASGATTSYRVKVRAAPAVYDRKGRHSL